MLIGMRLRHRLMDGDPAPAGGGSLLTQPPAAPPATPPATPPAATPPATPPAATPPPSDMPEWLKGMGQGFEDNEHLKRFKGTKELAAAYASAHKFISSDKIAVPGKHATEEEWKGIYKKLGLPEKDEEYKLAVDEKAKVDPTFAEEYRKKAHALGLMPHQAQNLINWVGELSQQTAEKSKAAFETKITEGIAGLKKEWGDAYNTNLSRAVGVIQNYADPELRSFLDSTRLGDNPSMIKMLAVLGEKLNAEGKIIEGGNPPAGPLTPEGAKAAINKIMQEPTHAYYDKSHPGHKAAVDEVMGLYKQMLPEAKEIKLRNAK